jgi:hypothetical protein
VADAPHPAAIERAVSEAMQLLAELPEDDAKLIADSLEGETRFFAVLDSLAEAALADARLVEAARERIKRIETRAERHRDIIRRMLEVAEMRKAERPLFTASIAYRTKALVTNADALPEHLTRRSPDMIAIAKALKDGAVPGAEISNATPTLTLRTG